METRIGWITPRRKIRCIVVYPWSEKPWNRDGLGSVDPSSYSTGKAHNSPSRCGLEAYVLAPRSVTSESELAGKLAGGRRQCIPDIRSEALPSWYFFVRCETLIALIKRVGCNEKYDIARTFLDAIITVDWRPDLAEDTQHQEYTRASLSIRT
ncbi:hypothetical protein NEOLEDRAFT_1131484 [Neolentinus lepideus HHB14362 ss-1]|uniref:Uncharacterized protein n=1 Tax=Neolentinus lepideus HHB14362 ss-1 TaxID=1314782 RepID=A0A165TPM6_9AGAM|nr:hypothetical protein NEOLEDRAFT_1131484 [Neolentinus lepideus HHB14362 ss-1]